MMGRDDHDDVAWVRCRFCGAVVRGDASVFTHMARRCVVLHRDTDDDVLDRLTVDARRRRRG